MALQGLLSREDWKSEFAAKEAFGFADAMIAHEERNNE